MGYDQGFLQTRVSISKEAPLKPRQQINGLNSMELLGSSSDEDCGEDCGKLTDGKEELPVAEPPKKRQEKKRTISPPKEPNAKRAKPLQADFPENAWSCSVCTLVNENASFLACACCGAARSTPPAASVVDTADPLPSPAARHEELLIDLSTEDESTLPVDCTASDADFARQLQNAMNLFSHQHPPPFSASSSSITAGGVIDWKALDAARRARQDAKQQKERHDYEQKHGPDFLYAYRSGVRSFLEQRAKSFKVASFADNVHSLPGSALYRRFQAAHRWAVVFVYFVSQ
jgi:hypothetical protein